MSYAPTDEQQAALDLFRSGQSLVIEAGAGTGKTSTLRMLATSTDARGLYVAFNKAIVVESSQSMPANVHCSTAHALAMRAVGGDYRHRLGGPRVKSAEIARRLRIDPVQIQAPSGPKRLAPGYLGGHVLRAVTMFCQSADPEPTERHFPYIEGIDAMLPDGRRGYANNNDVARRLVPALREAWADINSTHGDLPFKHDHYLKIWQLSHPVLPFDFIMFDEAQDASPVMAAVIEEQGDYGIQLVFVGDSQQAIYGFTGAVNALGRLNTEHRTMLSRSFRFGPEIATKANRILAMLEADLRIEGAGRPGTVGECDAPDVILARTNATCVRTAMNVLRDGGRPAIVGGADDVVRFAKACEDLRREGWTSHPELACFKTWGEVQDYVSDDPNGGDLSLLVRLVDEFGADIIIDSLQQCSAEDRATVLLSTAHKAKGREWDTVRLADDFPTGFDRDGMPIGCPPEELRLLYVAVTRARLHLDTGGNPLLGNAPVTRSVELAPEPMTMAPDGTLAGYIAGPLADPPGIVTASSGSVPASDVEHGWTVTMTDDKGAACTVFVDIIAIDEGHRKILGKDSEGIRHMATLDDSARVLVVSNAGRQEGSGR